MSALGVLIVCLTVILVLGGFAAWLLNIPMWAIGAFLAAGVLVIRRVYRRLVGDRARQETEAGN